MFYNRISRYQKQQLHIKANNTSYNNYNSFLILCTLTIQGYRGTRRKRLGDSYKKLRLITINNINNSKRYSYNMYSMEQMLVCNTHLICHFLNWDFGNFNVCIKIHIKVWLESKMVAELEENRVFKIP